MSDSKSPSASNGDFQFSSDEEYRRPRRAAVNRGAFVESGSDSDEPAKKRKQPKKKISKKQPPAKKAKIGSSSDSDSDGDLGDKDSKMEHLTEKERELEIFRHIEQQELLKTRKQIQEKLLGGDEEKPSKSKKKGSTRSDKESGEESSSSSDGEAKISAKRDEPSEESEIDMDPSYHRPSDLAEKLEKKKAIADLVKSRKEKKLQEQKKKETLDVDKVFGASSDSEESSSSDSSESDSEDSDDEREHGVPESLKEPITETSHLNMMKISRFRLSKICHAPFFEKTVTGCFVRVGVGVNNGEQVYRAAQVIGVCETAKQYNVEKVRTNKGLRLKHGPDERVYRLEFISNQPISEKEFYKWKDAMLRAGLPLPSIELAERKRKDIEDASNYTFTDEDIKAMVNENLKFKTAPINYAVHKVDLLRSKLDAEQRGDFEKAAEIQNEIDSIDEHIKRREREMNQEGVAVTFINQRNRDLQRQTVAQIKPDDTNKEDDPFTRKSGKMKPVSGRAKMNQEGINGESSTQMKDETRNLGTPKSSNTMTHSASAPLLSKFDPSLLLGTPEIKQVNSPNAGQASSSTSSQKEGRLSLAEYRRRKAQAGAAGN